MSQYRFFPLQSLVLTDMVLAGYTGSRRMHAISKGSSAAQSCNGDILLDLFPYLSESDLAHAAVICRAWSAAARISLYNTISFNSKSSRATQLTWTLRTHRQLRELVRHLDYTSHQGDPEPPDWLALLPDGSLRTFIWGSNAIIFRPGDILCLPAVRAVSKLVLHIDPSSKTEGVWSAVQDAAHSPSLLSLSVGPSIAQWISFPSGLKRFSVLDFAYTESIKRLVTDPNTQLERFDAYIGYPLCNAHAIMQDLCMCQTRLKHLSLITNVTCQYIPLDKSLRSFPFLETLVCSSAICSLDLLLHLPPTIRSLTVFVRAFARDFNFTRAIKDYLASTEAGSCQRRLPETITIVDLTTYSWELAKPAATKYIALGHQRMDDFADVCAAVGIRLDWFGVREMAESDDYLRPYMSSRPYLI